MLLHAAIVAWLVELLLIRCLGLGTRWYAGALAALPLLTPAAWYVGFVMPDLLAGILILGAAMLVSDIAGG